MIDWEKKNLETYNKSAVELAKYFAGIGARTKDINRAFSFVKTKNPKVVEVGCGDGRDAEEITRLTMNYVGFDPSIGLLDIAKKRLPKTKFELNNAINFEYPNGLDVIFSFASLLHSDKDELAQVLKKAAKSLKQGGVFYISLKYMPSYQSAIKKDRFGERQFYFYTPELLQELAGTAYEAVYSEKQKHGSTKWFTIMLKKSYN